jgi:tetratricopeptide (TPR) repeat protein
MTIMSFGVRRSILALAVAGLCAVTAAPALAASGGGGGNMPPEQVCNKGWVWSKALQRCVRANSGSLDDKELFEQGRALALAGHYGNALAVLAVVSNQNDAMVLTYIGYSHRKMGDVDVGIGYYKQALAIDPQNLNTREYLGEGYISAGKPELASLELATIEQLCGNRDCEQYQDLANAIAGRPD